MWRKNLISCALVVVTISGVLSQSERVDIICTRNSNIDQCEQIQRGDSGVNCQWVQDSIECAKRLMNGTADFGVFTPESALHLSSLGWNGMTVLREIRHMQRYTEAVDFESVVIVRATFPNGLSRLNGTKFCHPGLFYGSSQKWSERFLKHFEREVVPRDCNTASTSPAEIEVENFNNFFGPSCRPGTWSHDLTEDALLKAKYPKLCELCGTGDCTYPIDDIIDVNDHHQLALKCMKQGGDVTYVSAQDAHRFFGEDPELATEFAYLCQNGTTQNKPCTWLRQPWSVIISNQLRSMDISQKLTKWLNSISPWELALREIIETTTHKAYPITIQTPREHMRMYRPVPLPTDYCNTGIGWCTISPEENEKCEVISHAGLSSGVLPEIECKQQGTNDLSCVSDINAGRSDFTGIDSNLGYIGRNIYNLTKAVYVETENDKQSSVVVVVREGSRFERFENLKNAKACLPEYGGIATLAFTNIGKSRGFMPKEECHMGSLLNNFFGESCFPGARDKLHDPNGQNDPSMCALCRPNLMPGNKTPMVASDVEPAADDAPPADEPTADEPTADEPPPADALEKEWSSDSSTRLVTSCDATDANRFYGNKGALQCLSESGEVAILEQQNLNEHAATLGLNPHDFRIICRNGTLAAYTGFDVDEDCLLTTIVAGEVLVRRKDPKTQGVINALLSIDKYTTSHPDFKMYNIYDSKRHLLFKDSAIGLTSGKDTNKGVAVQNYISLFSNLEACIQSKDSAHGLIVNVYTIILSVISLIMLRYV